MISSLAVWLILRHQLLSSRRHRSDGEGFTLLELLIVAIIMGILAAIAIPAYVATVDKFRYGGAKIQMDCLAKELKIFKTEKGYFPDDTSRDIAPEGMECFYKQSSGQIPFNSKYDYENWAASSNGCFIQITFLGKNGEKDTANGTIVYSKPGFYEDKDDLVLSLGTFSAPCKK